MKTFEEYLKEIHSKYYMGTDDDMSDNFDTWLSRLDTSEFIYYADDFKNLAEQSLVQRIREDIFGVTERHINWKPTEGYHSEEELGYQKGLTAEAKLLAVDILSLQSLTHKPKGDE